MLLTNNSTRNETNTEELIGLIEETRLLCRSVILGALQGGTNTDAQASKAMRDLLAVRHAQAESALRKLSALVGASNEPATNSDTNAAGANALGVVCKTEPDADTPDFPEGVHTERQEEIELLFPGLCGATASDSDTKRKVFGFFASCHCTLRVSPWARANSRLVEVRLAGVCVFVVDLEPAVGQDTPHINHIVAYSCAEANGVYPTTSKHEVFQILSQNAMHALHLAKKMHKIAPQAPTKPAQVKSEPSDMDTAEDTNHIQAETNAHNTANNNNSNNNNNTQVDCLVGVDGLAP